MKPLQTFILPSNSGSANLSNSHFSGPTFSNTVGGITGYEGAGGSAAALTGNPGYKIVMKGGKSFRRGGKIRNRSRSRSKQSCKCRSKCLSNCRCKKSCNCRSKHRRSQRRHTMRGGGLSATAAPFNGGANLPYQQYMSNQPNTPVFSVGSKTILQNSALANPPPITFGNRCEK